MSQEVNKVRVSATIPTQQFGNLVIEVCVESPGGDESLSALMQYVHEALIEHIKRVMDTRNPSVRSWLLANGENSD